MSLSDEEKSILIKRNIEKLDSLIEEIDFYIDNDKLSTAVNRIYYGIFYLLTALALKKGFSTSKHMQLISWFNNTFVREKIVDQRYGKIIRNIFEQRSKADYDVLATFSKEQVENLFADMKDSVKKIKELLND